MKNPKGKKLTAHQEKALELSEQHGLRARVIELGVARFLTEESGYGQGIAVARDMLNEALELRKFGKRVMEQANMFPVPRGPRRR